MNVSGELFLDHSIPIGLTKREVCKLEVVHATTNRTFSIEMANFIK